MIYHHPAPRRPATDRRLYVALTEWSVSFEMPLTGPRPLPGTLRVHRPVWNTEGDTVIGVEEHPQHDGRYFTTYEEATDYAVIHGLLKLYAPAVLPLRPAPREELTASNPATALCPASGNTVDRWHAPDDPMVLGGPWGEDPGPYTEGEHIPCPRCGTGVPVTPVADNRRDTGRQYVARLAEHRPQGN